MTILQPAADTASVASIIAVFTGILPAIATIFAIIWYALMIYDWYEKRRAAQAALVAAAIVAEARVVAADVVTTAAAVAKQDTSDGR